MILASDIPLNLWLALPTAAAYALTALIGPRLTSNTGHRLLSVPWALHGLGLVFALFAPQDGGIRFGFAPALSVTAWLMLTFYVLEQHWFPQLRTRWTLSIVGAAVVLLAALFPGSALHMQASPLLPLHLALGVASYGLFAAAVVHAWLMTRVEKNIRLGADTHVGLPLLTLERLTFRFVTAAREQVAHVAGEGSARGRLRSARRRCDGGSAWLGRARRGGGRGDHVITGRCALT